MSSWGTVSIGHLLVLKIRSGARVIKFQKIPSSTGYQVWPLHTGATSTSWACRWHASWWVGKVFQWVPVLLECIHCLLQGGLVSGVLSPAEEAGYLMCQSGCKQIHIQWSECYHDSSDDLKAKYPVWLVMWFHVCYSVWHSRGCVGVSRWYPYWVPKSIVPLPDLLDTLPHILLM